MKFKPLIGTDLSGHIGGVVASHNTYGPYFRQRVRPVNRKTEAQQAQRRSIASVSQTWRELDPTVQASWQAATVTKTSRKGDRVTLTGSAAFQFINTLRARLGLNILTDPPTSSPGAAISPPNVVFTSSTTVDVTFGADDWNQSGGGVIVSGGLLTSRGVGFKTAELAVTGLTNPGTSPVSVALPFAVPIGGRVRLQFHATGPDGRQSTYVTVDTLNSSWTPPSPVAARILRVQRINATTAMWTLDRPVVFGGTSPTAAAYTLTALTPSSATQLPSGDEILVVYSGDPVGAPWLYVPVNETGTVTPAIAAASGTVL